MTGLVEPDGEVHGDGNLMPPDPISVLTAAATQMHEMYAAYVEAGFTEGQAMQIILTMLSASVGQGGG